ncbi:hypothetical protein HCA68_01160 [Listeria booriae]|uniref:hypothetical protein n=1 Tax=Listeria booriae TaxID=1552123 RepID=UPI00162782BC|nr:hypothetical protein [Listeria booriae]MBC1273905.1 hypothetical protein [Listeria booriae]MBC1896267.1 hypothetical protein [Listeria booriae]
MKEIFSIPLKTLLIGCLTIYILKHSKIISDLLGFMKLEVESENKIIALVSIFFATIAINGIFKLLNIFGIKKASLNVTFHPKRQQQKASKLYFKKETFQPTEKNFFQLCSQIEVECRFKFRGGGWLTDAMMLICRPSIVFHYNPKEFDMEADKGWVGNKSSEYMYLDRKDRFCINLFQNYVASGERSIVEKSPIIFIKPNIIDIKKASLRVMVKGCNPLCSVILSWIVASEGHKIDIECEV